MSIFPLSRGMNDFYNQKVKELFRLDYLYPWQRLVIADTLEGMGYFGEELREESSGRKLVILPTGAGKTLCFLMPALLTRGITLVLYPLLALMNDQARRLTEEGHHPVVFRGGQTRREREEGWTALAEGKSRIILSNPETVGSEEFLERLASLPLAHLVIDEVHTIPQWGPSFRKGLLKTADLVEKGIFPVVSAFTATASPRVQEEIGSLVFGGGNYRKIMADPDRPNIHYHVLYTRFVLTALEELCLGEEKPILIFCRTRSQTEETARYLERRIGGKGGVGRVRFYHAGLEKDEKEEVEAWFLKAGGAVLCSTSAYGMGVDCRGLRTVIHRDLPYSVESYIQESGRAGRGGELARAFLLVPSVPEGDEGIAPFINRRDRCRRALLMEELGRESGYCGGCDVCSPGRYIPVTEAREERLMRIMKRYCPALSKKEWMDFLKGYGRGFSRCLTGWGMLGDMEREQIADVLEWYEREGFIQIKTRGLWKNRVFVKMHKEKRKFIKEKFAKRLKMY